MSNFKLSRRSVSRVKGINPKLLALINAAILISPIDFGIPEHGGIRTVGQQAELFRKKPVSVMV